MRAIVGVDEATTVIAARASKALGLPHNPPAAAEAAANKHRFREAMAAAGLPPELRKKAIFWGIIGATVLRIFFAVIVVQLLAIIGIKVVGGLLLLWVCWRMWQEIRAGGTVEEMEREAEENAKKGPPKTMRTAMTNILSLIHI